MSRGIPRGQVARVSHGDEVTCGSATLDVHIVLAVLAYGALVFHLTPFRIIVAQKHTRVVGQIEYLLDRVEA